MSWNIESKTGADLTGSDGAVNRTCILTKSNIVADSIRIISADYPQVTGGGYSYDSDANTITFVKNVFDDYVIEIQFQIIVQLQLVRQELLRLQVQEL